MIRRYIPIIALGILALLAGCAGTNGGTVTLPEIGGDVCYDVAFDKGAGAGRVCMHLTPGPDGVPEIKGAARISPS